MKAQCRRRRGVRHPVLRVAELERVGAYTLRVAFDDGAKQVIDFSSVLAGPVYGPLRDERVFDQVTIDPEVRTLVWPNGADFDPATLHDWPKYADELKRLAGVWKQAEPTTSS
ncbi:MAG: DUF2442 domain-containing protein [Anaerolineae bacterium]|nr:DUF2442 domain-containing protein [Anaerolineae bacterium]